MAYCVQGAVLSTSHARSRLVLTTTSGVDPAVCVTQRMQRLGRHSPGRPQEGAELGGLWAQAPWESTGGHTWPTAFLVHPISAS